MESHANKQKVDGPSKSLEDAKFSNLKSCQCAQEQSLTPKDKIRKIPPFKAMLSSKQSRALATREVMPKDEKG